MGEVCGGENSKLMAFACSICQNYSRLISGELGDCMFKKGRIAAILASLAMLGIIISACGSSNTSSTSGNSTQQGATQGPQCVNGSVTFDGSTALFPLANDVANAYTDKCNGAIITPKQSGSSAGLTAASNGSVA